MATQFKILFVCTGNICRSPMAQALFDHHVHMQGLQDILACDSCGTHGYHRGEGADPRTLQTLQNHNIATDGLMSRPIKGADYTDFDLLIAMDHTHKHHMLGQLPQGLTPEIRMMLDYTSGGDVPDPYYDRDDGFEMVYQMLDTSVLALIKSVRNV